jgi:hypothetical protein
MRSSPENITSLESNQVFVFGSNKLGAHKKGAAKQAMGFGAVMGQAEGLQGKTYGIPTKDHQIQTLPLVAIKKYVDNFILFASVNPHLEFLTTEIGCGLAGYKPKDIAPMFKEALKFENIKLPSRFLARLL